MPAVQLNRLRTQLQELRWTFTQPETFTAALRSLFSDYSDLTYRPSPALQSAHILPSFHIPPVILQQLELSLFPLIQENPSAALAVADELWCDDHIEMRRSAAYILGQIPASHMNEVLNRLTLWCRPQEARTYLEALLTLGSQRLRSESPKAYLNLIYTWLEDPDPAAKSLGLMALHSLVQDVSFENLPLLYPLLTSPLQKAPNTLHTELQQVVKALMRRSPNETTFYLRQVLGTSSPTSPAQRIIRRLLPTFSPETQEKLRPLLHSSLSAADEPPSA